ncbi:MAG: GIY-YIG nuclease family protein [Proteobacteria bacterium]|nr:GIY-YIG nuclease family protein [Pseudomonadota bacterium]
MRAHHVYILPTHDRSRAKIGRTRNGAPLDRITTLACTYPEIDLSSAVIVEVDTHKIEQILHIAFGPRRDRQGRRRDGFSEWFQGDIVEEALTFLETVAARRGTEYRVTRSIDGLIQAHRARNPQLGVRPARPTDAERDQRALVAEGELRNAALAGAEAVVDRLGERQFDSVLSYDNRRYLSRIVRRETEPECWSTEGAHRVSDWGQALVALADVAVTVEGGSGRWRFLDLPEFVATDATHGREYYRIPESVGDANDEADPLLDRDARRALEEAIAHLPVTVAASDPTRRRGANPGNAH